MATVYGTELAEKLTKELKELFFDEKNNQRLDVADQIIKIGMQLNILAGSGMMKQSIVVDENGNEVTVEVIKKKWGRYRYIAYVDGVLLATTSEKALFKEGRLTRKNVYVPCWIRHIADNYEVVRWNTNMVTGEVYGARGYREVLA